MTDTNSEPAQALVIGPDPRWPELPFKPTHFHGSVTLDTTRIAHDATLIADEVIVHLAGLPGAKVTVTLEITAEIPGGIPGPLVSTVYENSKTLKFSDHSFDPKL